MRVQIQRIDPSLPLPKYESAGAVGFDLITREKAEHRVTMGMHDENAENPSSK